MRFQLGGAGKFLKISEIGTDNFINFQKFPPRALRALGSTYVDRGKFMKISLSKISVGYEISVGRGREISENFPRGNASAKYRWYLGFIDFHK
jgi:hypothetical protein